MAEFITNILRTRVFQFGAAFFCTALLATQVDVTSLIVNHDPPKPTHTSPPQFYSTTAKPSSTPLIWSTEPVKFADYEPTTSFLDVSAVKTVYVFDYVHQLPSISTPRPEASVKPPRRPSETYSIPTGPRAHTYSSEPLTGNETPPTKYWKLQGFQNALFQMKHQVLDILTNIKAHILVNFPGMTPSFGMIAYYQFNHIQSLLTRDREIEGLREWAEMWEGSLTRAVKVAEALQNALTIAQQTSKQKLQEAAEEKSRLLYRIRQKDETIATMSAETQRLTQEVKNSTEEGGQSSKNGTDTATTDKNIIAELKAQLKKANHERRAAEASGLRQSTIATELREQLKAAREKTLEAESKQADTAKRAEAAEERVSQLESRIESLANTLATNNTAFVEAAFRANEAEDNATKTRKALKEHIAELVGQHVENQRVKDAEEAARRAKGEANHLVKSQVGQLNKLKATCDAYRERYGKLDDVKPSTATMSNVNALPSAPSISLNGSSQTPVKESTEGTSQSASVEDAKCQAQNVPPNASSAADDRSDTCPNPASTFDPGNERGTGHKKKHRRGARPRSSKNPPQPEEGLAASTPSGPKAQREVESGEGAGRW